MLLLDLYKWLLGAGCCTALSVGAGLVYLFGAATTPELISPHWYQQPLLLFFGAMLLLALMLNVLAVFGIDFRAPSLLTFAPEDRRPEFAELALQFVRQQGGTALPGEKNYYLHRENAVLYYLQDGAEPALDIGRLRHIFQQMLRYQCHTAFALVPSGLQSPAQIFALEANIRVLDQQQLRWHFQLKKT